MQEPQKLECGMGYSAPSTMIERWKKGYALPGIQTPVINLATP